MEKMTKQAILKLQTLEDSDLRKINKYTLEPLKAEQVFSFKIMAGDNGDDDRNYEPFSSKSIEKMAKLYPGKPMIWNHGRAGKDSGQVARVYDAQAMATGKVLKSGDPEMQLVLKAYMPILESNKDLIAEIKAGIKKEVSTSCRPEKLVCSICGEDNIKNYCRHWPGEEYDGKQCLMTIDGVKDVFEISFVGTPAQPRAGLVKSYNPRLKDVTPDDFKEIEEAATKKDAEAPDFDLIEAELFLMREKSKED